MADDTCTDDPKLVTPIKRGRGRPKKYKTPDELSKGRSIIMHRYNLKKRMTEGGICGVDDRLEFLKGEIEKFQKEIDQLEVIKRG